MKMSLLSIMINLMHPLLNNNKYYFLLKKTKNTYPTERYCMVLFVYYKWYIINKGNCHYIFSPTQI